MADYLISVDAGNGGVNAIRDMKRGYRSIYFPSVRAAATGDSLHLGEEFEIQYDYVDWGGYRYVIGDDVVRVTRRNLERHHGAWRYGDEFHQFLVAVAVGQLGVKKGSVDLTLFAPPGLYVDAQKMMRKRFAERNGQVGLCFRGDRKPRSWRYEQVTIWPEGIGAAACFAIDDDGKQIETDVLADEVVILDLGMYTLDVLKMQDGKFNAESLETASWENGGLKVHLFDPMLRVIKKQSDEFALLTVDDLDLVIRQGLKTGDYDLHVAGVTVDLEPILDKYSKRYAEWIANNIVDGVFSGLRGIRSAILVGGGAVLVRDHLNKWYANKLLNFNDHEITQHIHPVDANAVGGLRLAKLRLRQEELEE